MTGFSKRLGFPAFALAAALGTLPALAAAALGDSESNASVKLETMSWSKLQALLSHPGKARYTLVDAWSTTCGPCKENFPHVLEMHKKFASQGLRVVSLSLDDPSDKAAVAEAERFLKEKHSLVTNVLLDEPYGAGFEKLNINTIPAVFIYGPDGKEVQRFTMDDTKHQFTYAEVEQAVEKMLENK